MTWGSLNERLHGNTLSDFYFNVTELSLPLATFLETISVFFFPSDISPGFMLNSPAHGKYKWLLFLC